MQVGRADYEIFKRAEHDRKHPNVCTSAEHEALSSKSFEFLSLKSHVESIFS